MNGQFLTSIYNCLDWVIYIVVLFHRFDNDLAMEQSKLMTKCRKR